MRDLLQIYERMIHGDLRPNLTKFVEPGALLELEKQFYSFTFFPKVTTTDEVTDKIGTMAPSIKSGDQVEININEDTHEIFVKGVPNPGEEDLINLELPPAENDLEEVFFRIIDDEYLRIRQGIASRMREARGAKQMKSDALQLLARTKMLAREAHEFSKRLNGNAAESTNSPREIISRIKKHLIYTIQEIQEHYSIVLGIPAQQEHSLRDELFEMEATKSAVRVSVLQKKLEQKLLERLYKALPETASLQDKIFVVRAATAKKIQEMKASEIINNAHREDANLYLSELGRLLNEQLTELIIGNEPVKDSSTLSFLLRERTALQFHKTSVDYLALKTTDFFDRLDAQIRLAHDLNTSERMVHQAGLLGDLAMSVVSLQGRVWISKENHFNDYLADLLRARQYSVSDQTRHGKSSTGKESGSLDLAIRDSSGGVITSIIESFILDSAGPDNKVIKLHLQKLVESYDTAGNLENFAIIFNRAKAFEKLWSSYKDHVRKYVFDNKNVIADQVFDWFPFENVKIGLTELREGGRARKLYHIFVNMSNS